MSHCINLEHIRQLAMPPFACMPRYVEWYLVRLTIGYRVPIDFLLVDFLAHAYILPIVVLDALAPYIDDDDPDDVY